MSNCETYRELLVEAAYDEIAAADESRLQEHLAACPKCAARGVAFQAVRQDLQGWDVQAPRPSRVTFVTVPAVSRTSVWTRRLAAAASFVVGFLLIAALANLEVQSAPDGWSVRTSLIPRAAETGTADAGDVADDARPKAGPVERLDDPQPRFGVPVSQGGEVQVMSQSDLDQWLERRLQARNVQRPTGMANLQPEQVKPVLDELMRERELQFRGLVQEMLASAETRQRSEIDAALTGLYQAFEAQRTNDLLFLAGELGLLQEATGQELQRTNAAIDYLIGLEATTGSQQQPDRQQEPEREQEPQR